jgi:glycine cleavage system transcriptional repressor
MNTQFPNVYVLNVMSDDHPGIISAVSTTVRSLGGNIDAASQTVLGGYFTLIMVVSLPQPIEPASLAARVRGPEATGLQVVARALRPGDVERPPGRAERFVMTAFGKDKPGIIARLSACLAGKDINITDLSWTRTDGDFIMIGELEIPARVEFALLQADLEQIGREEGFMLKLQHENIFVATNQLRLTRSPSGRG